MFLVVLGRGGYPDGGRLKDEDMSTQRNCQVEWSKIEEAYTEWPPPGIYSVTVY